MPSRNIKDAHEKLQEAWPLLLTRFELKSPGKTLNITCTHRTPEEQLVLFRQGRHNVGSVQQPVWEKTDFPEGHVMEDNERVVTNCDGFVKVSRHNKYPAEAIDVVVIDTISRHELWHESYYLPLGPIVEGLGLTWGGNWPRFKDLPHIEIPVSLLKNP